METVHKDWRNIWACKKGYFMLEIIFINVILFQNIILRFLPDNKLFNYWDELVFIVLFCFLMIKFINNKIKINEIRYVFIFGGIICIGIIGNITFKYQTSINAIIRDIIGFLKFPLTLVTLYKLNFTKKMAKKFYKIIPLIKMIMMIIFILGIISLFVDLGLSQPEYRHGIHPYMFLFTHPTYITTFEIMILLALNAANDCTFIDECVALLTIALGMRTRGFVFIAIYFFIKYGKAWFKRVKVLYWLFISILIMAVSYSKLMLYVSYSTSPRETLYKGSLQLIKLCMPIGSGFGTFASHLSAKMMSGVYNVIHIAGLYNDNGTISPVIGDAGYPYYIGQFGIMGLALIAFLIIKLIKMTQKGINKDRNFSINMMWLMIATSLITETILVNDGVEVAVMMAIIAELSRMDIKRKVRVKLAYLEKT